MDKRDIYEFELCTLVKEKQDLRAENNKLKEALLFLCRRCEEQGFYSPTRQPVVQEALSLISSSPADNKEN